ncbi:MAG: PQQ-binding-like beta-propeller repeat protein [Propionibacteriaceae bacterium]|nr:PQQ-binding-like beta-propeller repeat protein [Propionibacteriaceae bacterium]
MGGWVRGGLIAVLLAWLLFTTALLSVPGSDGFRGAEARFVPASGAAARVVLDAGPEGGTPLVASVEHTLFTGLQIAGEVPTPMLTAIRPPEGVPRGELRWWRQTVTPDSMTSGQRMTVRTIVPTGVLLAAHTGPAGVAFQPALLELPADVAPGSQWSSAGVARDVFGSTDYRHAGEAHLPADPALGERGCLAVRSTTTLRDTHTDEAVWCPGQGIVQGAAPLGPDVAPLGDRAWPQTLRTIPTPDWPIGPPRTTPTTPTLLEDDPVFGTAPAVGPVPRLKSVTADDTLVTVDINSSTLIGWSPRGDQLAAAWWAHPGGTVLSLTAFDDRVLVTTSDRRIVAYASNGRRLWSHITPDLAPGGMTALGADRVVVATVSGDLDAYRLDTGDRLWRTTFPAGTDRAVVVLDDLVLVRTKDDALAAFGADGDERWHSEELLDAVGIARSGDVLLLVSRTGETLRVDAGTGRVVAASVIGFGSAHTRLVTGPQSAALVSEDGVRIVTADTARELAFVPGGTAVTATGQDWRVLTPGALLTLDARGVEIGRRTLTAPVAAGAAMILTGPVPAGDTRPLLWVLGPGGVTWVR